MTVNDETLIAAVKHLSEHGPVTTFTGNPCSYDVATYLGCENNLYPRLRALALLPESPLREQPNGIYPPEFSVRS